MATMLEAALYYARRGWPIFPCREKPGEPYKDKNDEWVTPLEKQPYLAGGFKNATTDIDTIRGWWQRWPDAAIGLDCGRAGLVVADLDVKEDQEGIKNFEELDILHDCALHSQTPSGGQHIIFKDTTGGQVHNSASLIGNGIDIRGNGGYILLPPSNLTNGAYKRLDDWKREPGPVPQELLALIAAAKPEKQDRPEHKAAPSGQKIPAGKRNQMLASLAGTMRRRGMDEAAIKAALIEENLQKCDPPLTDVEVERIASSVARYEPEEPPENNNKVPARLFELSWAFGACAFSQRELALSEVGWLDPKLIPDTRIRKFWHILRETQDHIQAASDAGILSDLLDWVSKGDDPVNIIEYAAELARGAYLEKVAKQLPEITRGINEGDMSLVQGKVAELAGIIPFASHEPHTAAEGLDQFIYSLDNLTGRSIKTGILPIDDATGGLERQTLSILAARPSMGKSTLAWQIARNIATSGKKALFVSLEMSEVQLWAKAACGVAQIRWRDVRAGTCDYSVYERLKEIARGLRNVYEDRLLVDDSPNTTESIWQMVTQSNPDIVIIDHLRLIQDKADNEVIRLGVVTQRMKDLAKKYNCHVMILAQLNRDLEKRTESDKRPQLADLRDSGQIEENADTVLMMYRDDYYDDKATPVQFSETEVWIRKFRDDVRNQKIITVFDTKEQWFKSRQEANSR